MGRFISPDGLDYLDPESLGGLNLYAYCNNNPVMYYDPSGTLAILAILTIIGAVIGAVVGGLIAGFTAANIFGTDNVGAIICSALLGVIFGAAVGALTGLIAGSFGPAVGGMAASGTTAALVGTKIGAWVLSGVAVASGVAVTVGGAQLIGNVNFAEIVNENGVQISHKYPNDHGHPVHVHIEGGGRPTRVGPNGYPVGSDSPMSEIQRKVFWKHYKKIRKVIKKWQKWIRAR